MTLITSSNENEGSFAYSGILCPSGFAKLAGKTDFPLASMYCAFHVGTF